MPLRGYLSQTLTLTKKDLLIIRRRWFSTFIRAVAFPIVLTIILASVKSWIHNNGGHGIGTPSPIRSLPEAFDIVGSARKKFVIVDRNLPGDDVRYVIDQLSTIAREGGRNVRILSDDSQILNECPGSSKGATNCFGAVDFWHSPDERPGSIWNYTIWQDSVIRGANVQRDDNAPQIYTLPLQRAIDTLISTRNNGSVLPSTVLQYPFTHETQAQKDFEDDKFFGVLITQALAFAFFLAMCGIAYHLTGHVVWQREDGILELIDAQMSKRSPWPTLFARTLATHAAFDIIYAPGWIVSGAVAGKILFPHSPVGWFVLMYLLAGLAMTSFSMLASSLFRRQQLSAISATVAAIALAIVAQFSQSGQASTNKNAVIATGLLFPPSSFVYFLVSAAVTEIFGQPLRPQSSSNGILGAALGIKVWDVTPATLLAFFTFQIVVYPILGIVIERFMWGSSFRGRHFKSNEQMQGNALRIRNFTKRYNKAVKKQDRTLAVDDLSLDVFAGQIVVLLGANGSGKSTTFSCIAGLESITNGNIDINDHGGIGLCPQNNVMWADMTVEEHVWFFQQLKSPHLSKKEGKREIARLIASCDLGIKITAKAKTLSGGQKRKLQLCMMLAGGSEVCCIDEATSGLDPIARRKIWDILLQERGHRTILLTTHFLDESEVLADYIAILSKGQLRAQGSVASLKTSLGQGYRVILNNHSAPTANLIFDQAIEVRHAGNDTVFDAPTSAALTALLFELDKRGLTRYKIEFPSVEKIFLRLADELRFEQAGTISSQTKSRASDGLPQASDAIMELHTGRHCGFLQQTRILFRKRLTVLKHNFMPYIAALFVPLVVAGLAPRFLRNDGGSNLGLRCSNPNQVYYQTTPYSIGPYTFNYAPLVLGPTQGVLTTLERLLPVAGFQDQYTDPAPLDGSQAVNVTRLDDFNTAIKGQAVPDSYTAGGIFMQNLQSTSPSTFAWPADGGQFVPWMFQLQAAVNMVQTNASVAVSYNTFAEGYVPRDYFQGLLAVFTVLGFCLFPGLFALYPTRERLQKVRAMQYSNGISSGSIWTAYALFDFCWLLLIAALSIAIWAAVGYGWYGLGYLFIVFVFFGTATTAYAYIISLFVPSQLAQIAMTTIVQVVIAMLFFTGYILTVVSADITTLYRNLSVIYYTIALICPAVSLMRALLVCLNVYALACDGDQLASNPSHISRYGGPILYLVLQSLAAVAFLIFWESGCDLQAFGIRVGRKHRQAKDLELRSYAVRNNSTADGASVQSNKGLRVRHISKAFGENQAVEDVSFDVLPSEKFALLGPNGAGKSTLISLIRGDLNPDAPSAESEICVNGDSMMYTPVAAKQHLGVCPQFDAVDAMTLKEHLEFYGRARGLTEKEKDENIRIIITRLELHDHANKLVKKLSGGTKRKLSLGIALIANPSVLLLDEPSSGMDAAAKRLLWATLQAISSGRSLLITTHSMEEADALCDRAGIMDSRMLALDNITSLHDRFSDKIYVHLVHNDAPRSSSADMDALWQWLRSTFLIAEAEKSLGGQIRVAIPVKKEAGAAANLLDGSSIGALFGALQTKKEELKIRDYSVGYATLDQVFLNVVSRHSVDGKNTGLTHHGKKGRIFARVREVV